MIKDMETEISTIEEQISRLTDRKRELVKTISEANKRMNHEKYLKWGVNANDCLLLFTKELHGYHSCLIRGLRIQEVDTVNQYIDYITVDYNEYDYQYTVKALEHQVHFSQLSSFEESFNIYVVPSTVYASMLASMCNLSISYKDYKDCEKEIERVAIRKISVDIFSK